MWHEHIIFGTCRVIFGMLIALPITLVYYILLGLWYAASLRDSHIGDDARKALPAHGGFRWHRHIAAYQMMGSHCWRRRHLRVFVGRLVDCCIPHEGNGARLQSTCIGAPFFLRKTKEMRNVLPFFAFRSIALLLCYHYRLRLLPDAKRVCLAGNSKSSFTQNIYPLLQKQ